MHVYSLLYHKFHTSSQQSIAVTVKQIRKNYSISHSHNADLNTSLLLKIPGSQTEWHKYHSHLKILCCQQVGTAHGRKISNTKVVSPPMLQQS